MTKHMTGTRKGGSASLPDLFRCATCSTIGRFGVRVPKAVLSRADQIID
jgi:hypothetical protein